MKIKPPSRLQRKRALLQQKYVHYWLAPVEIKKSGRLGQMNKANRKSRRPSEFVTLARSLEYEKLPR